MARQKQTELTLETVIRWASTLSQPQRRNLIDALLALDEIEDSDHALSTNGNGNGGATAGGYIELKTINGCGPYRYLRFRSQGQYKSVYLGKGEQD